MLSMSDESEVYRELQVHLDTLPVGFPKTKSGIELKILRHFFTSEEAKIATKLDITFKSALEILEILDNPKISLEELQASLNSMASKGGLDVETEGDTKKYANALLVIGMFEHKVNKLDKEFIKDFFSYASMGGFGFEFIKTKIPQLRTIPIEESITPEHQVANYDDLRAVIESSSGPFSVQNCICRQIRDMDGIKCKNTERMEVCLTFGHEGQLYIDEKWGREISREECLDILQKNEEEGLILQASNYEDISFICSCCSCCCFLIGLIGNFPNPVQYFATNYHVVIDADNCTSCETCIDRCQMKALSMNDGVSIVDLTRCIGCGVCVVGCPSDALKLEKNDSEIAPPPTRHDLLMKISDKKKEILREEEKKRELKRKRREERKKQKG